MTTREDKIDIDGLTADIISRAVAETAEEFPRERLEKLWDAYAMGLGADPPTDVEDFTPKKRSLWMAEKASEELGYKLSKACWLAVEEMSVASRYRTIALLRERCGGGGWARLYLNPARVHSANYIVSRILLAQLEEIVFSEVHRRDLEDKIQ